MALGTSNQSDRTYLSVGFGKIRQKNQSNGEKVTKDTPNAVKRTTQSGNESWAIEYDFCEGKIENIFYRQDENYGNSFEVVLSDVADEYQLSFKEDSRFWTDLMKKLPNIDLSERVKLFAYDFESKGKRYVGMSVEQNGQKIQSFYSKKVGDSWKEANGFPSADGVDWKDKDELNIYLIKVRKFLRNEFKTRIEPKFEKVKEATKSTYELPGDIEELAQDLPF